MKFRVTAEIDGELVNFNIEAADGRDARGAVADMLNKVSGRTIAVRPIWRERPCENCGRPTRNLAYCDTRPGFVPCNPDDYSRWQEEFPNATVPPRGGSRADGPMFGYKTETGLDKA